MTEKEEKYQVKDTKPKSARGLRQASAQAEASLPFVPSRSSSALALERQLLKEAAAILKILLELNARQQWLSKE